MRPTNTVGILLLAAASLASAQDLGIRPIQPAGAELRPPIASAPLAVPTASTANPKAAPLPIEEHWSLVAGDTIGQNLATWAKRAKRSVVWQLPNDWVVPGQKTFTGSFPDAATSVINNLAKNGALVRAKIYEGNRIIVISGPGVPQQQ